MKTTAALARWLAGTTARLRTGTPRPIPPWESIRRVTLLKLDAIGDFVLGTAFLRPLEAACAGKQVSLIVRKPIDSLARQQFPSWEVMGLPRRETAWRNVFRQPAARQSLTHLARADLLVDLRWARDYSDAILASWAPSNCKVAIGLPPTHRIKPYAFLAEERVYDVLVPLENAFLGESTDIAQSRALATVILQQDFAPGSLMPRLIAPHLQAKQVREKLSRDHGVGARERFAVICPGASNAIREYPPMQLAEALTAALGREDVAILVAGTVADRESTDQLLAALSGHLRASNIVGAFSLDEHVALMAEASLVVAMETSHAHIAGALRVPTIALIGGGHFGDFGPWGESRNYRWIHQPLECYNCSWVCPYPRPRCIDEITPNRIATEIRKVWDQVNRAKTVL
jgi:ADP-heptose:LPS heptosyltransferase